MSMHDEDMLEELELWPQWHLRRNSAAPTIQPHKAASKLTEAAQSDIIIAEPSIATEWTKATKKEAVAPLKTAFRILVGNDASMLIVCNQTLSPIMQTLLKNLLKVMNFTIEQDVAAADTSNLANYHGAVVLVMGELLGQAILKQTLGIEQLRKQVHADDGRQIIVTYALSDLVNQPAKKVHCWQDLCLVQFTIDNLKSQD